MIRIFSLSAIVILMGITACQTEQTKKQYFEESPEIEIAKKAVKAFEEGDAETYRSCYADTAKIWQNQYWGKYPGKTIDEQMELLKTVHETQEYYSYEGEIWEMIIQNTGDYWVHFWANLHTKYIGDDDDIESVVHIAFRIIDDKIVYELLVLDILPFYLAEQRLKAKSEE